MKIRLKSRKSFSKRTKIISSGKLKRKGVHLLVVKSDFKRIRKIL